MSLTPPAAIAQALAAYDAKLAPISEIALQSSLRRAMGASPQLSADERRGAWAEVAAFHFVPADGPDRGPWGRYFKPIKTAVSKEGVTSYSPNAGDITRAILEYWEHRASESAHPMLRARYADLAFEFGQMILGGANDTGFGWVALDAYLDTVSKGITEHESQGWRFIERAIELALAVNDRGRLRRVKQVLFDYFRILRDQKRLVLWWKPDEIALTRRELELGAGEVQEILLGLEQTLARFSDANDIEQFDPQQTLAVADRLIFHRKRLDQPRQAVRVMKTAGLAVEAAAANANPVVAVGWLEELTRRYRELGMDEESARADALLETRRRRAEAAQAQATPHAEVVASSTWLERLTSGSVEDVLRRFATSFIGRDETAARGGAASGEFAPSAVQAALGRISQNSTLLAASWRHARERHIIDAAAIVAFLLKAPHFASGRARFLEAGTRAWLDGDPLKAIYVLTGECECALRQLGVELGEPATRMRGDGRVEATDFTSLLGSRNLAESMDSNVRLHLTALYGDGSGMGLGSRVAHGLAPFEQMGGELANWVMHSLLALSVVAAP